MRAGRAPGPLVGLVGLIVALASSAGAEEARVLEVRAGETVRRFAAGELLARPDRRAIRIPDDPGYLRPMRYEAVPLRPLLEGLAVRPGDAAEFRASDGFVGVVDSSLLLGEAPGGSEAWVAVEEPDSPWPIVPGKGYGAGPFYLVWLHPERSGVGREQWTFALVALSFTQPVAERYPALAVDPALPADAPARRGLEVFLRNCFACHRMNGAGTTELGPDLNLPRSPTEYLQPQALRDLVRSPKSVRDWPGERMPGFPPEVLPDSELEDLVAYLEHMAGRKAPAAAQGTGRVR